MPDRKKPSAGFWITVAFAAMLVGYPLSFGPACRMLWSMQWNGRFDQVNDGMAFVYRPILLSLAATPRPVRLAVQRFYAKFLPEFGMVQFNFDSLDGHWLQITIARLP